jgi:hypothetical protein
MPDVANLEVAQHAAVRAGNVLPPLSQCALAGDADQPSILAADPLVHLDVGLEVLRRVQGFKLCFLLLAAHHISWANVRP